ncbi:UPF0182 family protein [Clostridium pasteurianum]|uniref:UPF0182 family protein n=1 Tax=Clostridium pasteurianum TaxID=1501 RepID=UPI0003A212B3|nr:UPF0182 family protein [Clostridium pasteurianum]
MKKQIILVTTIFFIIVALIFSDRIVNFIINVQWYREVGYLSIYFTKLLAVLKLMIPTFVVLYFVFYLYYESIRKSFVTYKKELNIHIKKNKIKKRIFFIIDFIISFMSSFYISSRYWYKILQFQSSSPFNIKDPIFNIDISFYIFKLPLIESLYRVIMILLIFLVVITVSVYFVLFTRDKYIYGKNKFNSVYNFKHIKGGMTKFAGRQLAIVSTIIFLMLAVGYIIKGWNLVYSSRGISFGASYTDINVSLLFFRLIALVCLISSVITFVSLLKTKVKPIIISISLIIVLVISENAISFILQNVIVKSNERVLENKYIKYSMDFTKKAFNLDKIQVKPYDINDNLSQEDINNNMDTINNIKLNSFRQSLEFYNQVQVYRYYYNFNDIDVDRYNINGKQTEVFVSPREIDQNALMGNAGTWQNKHLSYTHGYGLVMSKVNSITSEGQPEFLMKDIPTNNNSGIFLNNPRIYFGENTNDYVIVNNKLGEFDYPNDSSDTTYNYNGKAGLKTNFINRLLFTINKRNFNFIVSSSIGSNSKILINRNILDRAQKIAPFLTYDKDPYAIAYNGRIYWIMDAYTTSDRYPFSQPINNINYIRNSVKVVVDAFNGDINFYQIDRDDPVANSYNKIFKGLFKDVNTLPQGIREHFRYAEELFNMQCNILDKYHVTDPNVFYNGEDLWSVSENQKSINGAKSVNDSSYVIMKLPDEKKEETVLLEYFNMKNKENMVGILAARIDGNHYGKLIMYSLPTEKTIYSPYLFKQRINQNPDISKEIALWNTQGSEVQFGDTSIIPIDNSLLYVEPLYLRAQGKNSIPEVKRVILSSGEKFVMAPDIGSALKQLFNNNNSVDTNQNKAAISDEKLKQAKDIYDKAIEAQKNGDWTNYDEYIKDLGNVLENNK